MDQGRPTRIDADQRGINAGSVRDQRGINSRKKRGRRGGSGRGEELLHVSSSRGGAHACPSERNEGSRSLLRVSRGVFASVSVPRSSVGLRAPRSSIRAPRFAIPETRNAPGSRMIPGRSQGCRRRPTLPRSRERSTIGAVGLNDRVRNGNECGPYALVASDMCDK